jgi:hypothetical protein
VKNGIPLLVVILIQFIEKLGDCLCLLDKIEFGFLCPNSWLHVFFFNRWLHVYLPSRVHGEGEIDG